FKRVFPYDGARKLYRWAQKPWTFWGKEMIKSLVWYCFHTYTASPTYYLIQSPPELGDLGGEVTPFFVNRIWYNFNIEKTVEKGTFSTV
ncbi:MAG: hypothetical protein F6K14_30185, partial [Symploca sp. SIO2C1]|nr:hypothetical protein [Symploca sp. SIO2C1]